MSVTFDTLAYARRMESVGFTRQQAEALADEQVKLVDERLATKFDIETVRHDIEQLRLATQMDLKILERDLTIKLGTIVVAVGSFLSILTHFWH